MAARRVPRVRPAKAVGRKRSGTDDDPSATLATYLIGLTAESATRVVVRADGSVSIPRSIRNALLLDPGDRLEVAFEGGVVTMRPVEAIVGGIASVEEDAARMPAGVIAEFLRKRRRR